MPPKSSQTDRPGDAPFAFTSRRGGNFGAPAPVQNIPPAPDPKGRGARSSPGYSRLNSILGLCIAVGVVLAAVPVGLNRPVLWLSWTGIVALVALAYLGLGWHLDRTRPLLSARHKPLFLLASLIPIYALVQSLPGLGGVVGSGPIPEAPRPDTLSLLPQASQLAAIRFAGYVLFAALAIEVASRTDRARRIGWLIFCGVVGHAVWSLVALNLLGDILIWGEEKSAYLGSATGTFVNRNSFATFLSMGAVLGLALMLERIDKPVARKARSRSFLTADRLDVVLVSVGLGLIWIALVSTGSRMGGLAAL